MPVARAHVTADLTNSHRFLTLERVYEKQYAHVYFHRLRQLKPAVRRVVERKLHETGESIPILDTVLDVSAHDRCVLIGALYKEMPRKPTVLAQFSSAAALQPLERTVSAAALKGEANERWASPDDQLTLEDDHGRIGLEVDASFINSVVTGVVVGVIGSEVASDGVFRVESVVCAGVVPDGKPVHLLEPKIPTRTSLVALISNFSVGQDPSPQPGHDAACMLVVEWLAGLLGMAAGDLGLSKAVERVVFAGNAMGRVSEAVLTASLSESQKGGSDGMSKSAAQREVASRAAAPVRMFDAMLSQLCNAVPVDVMPGADDPASHTVPQQPLAKCLLPMSVDAKDALKLVTNPYSCTVRGRTLLGTSGQPVNTLLRYTADVSPMDLLRSTLRWRHLAPCAPDTLAMYPFHKRDPLVIEETPHVYFSGNQDEFESTVEVDGDHSVRLLRLPSFSATRQIVLVDLADCTATTMSFGAF